MSETVYLFGAGINRGLQNPDGLRPPLATDFFQQALKHHLIKRPTYHQKASRVFEYIQKFWKLSIDQLKVAPFDLEECYTLLQLQTVEAKERKDHRQYRELLETSYRLTQMFAECLADLDISLDIQSRDHFESFYALGKLLFAEKPAIITFNYDTLLEQAIGSASGLSENVPNSYRLSNRENFGDWDTYYDVPYDLLTYSHFNWNLPLAYGIQFDQIALQQAGVPQIVPGARFYSCTEHKLYNPPLLKLHGSINWFVYSGIIENSWKEAPQNKRDGQTLLYRGHWWFNELSDLDGEIIEPVLITPVLYKDLRHPMIKQLWDRALEEMKGCKRLVVGGYSFPSTDFHAKRLFIEAFVDSPPKQLVVINPDINIVAKVKELCHFKKPVVWCRDLIEFITLSSQHDL